MSSGRRIIVLEDDALVSMVVEDQLTEADYVVEETFGRVRDALNWLATNTPDCAVLDVEVYDGTSEPVALHLANRGIPYVVISGYPPDMPGNDLSGYPSATDWITKPFGAEVLVEAIERAIQRGRSTAH